MKQNCEKTNTSFHLMEYMGKRFAYHYALGRFIELSHDAVTALRIFSAGDTALKNICDPSLRNELKQLEEAEFFRPYRPEIPADDTMESLLDKRYRTPWTKLELALSETCNLACRYCYCGTCRGIIENKGLMTVTTARQSINWLFAVSGKSENLSITFFGGEPLMNKEVLKFSVEYSQRLSMLHGKRIHYSMTTNGTLLDDDIISLIKRHNFGLMVSLDGPKALHDAQCPTQNGNPSHQLAVSGIKKLMARRRLVTVRCTMAHPAPNMMELIRYFDDFGFSRIVLGRVCNPVYHSPCDFTDQDFREHERQMLDEVAPWIASELKAGRKPKYNPFDRMLSENTENGATSSISPFRCGACRGTTTVGGDGTLYPCHRFVGMCRWQVGHISDGPDIEKCKDFWRKYRSLVKENCFGCWAYSLCKGPCPWEAAQADGTFRLLGITCRETKKWILMGAWFRSYLREMNVYNPYQRECQ